MRFSLAAVLNGLIGLSALAVAAAEVSETGALDDTNNQAIQALQVQEGSVSSLSVHGSKRCSLGTASIRRNWRALSKKERKAYIDAVLCIMNKPSKADPSFAPGAKSRYDDFVAVHINQTLSIHGTYWDWLDGSDFASSPIFDGSETSMSGDGAYVAHNGSLGGSNNIYLPSGNGGGCLKDGPFKDMVTNLGPVSPGMDGLTASPTGPLGYNPRCLRRDLTSAAVDRWMTFANVWNITVGAASRNITTFQDELQGRFSDEFLGVHAAGHFTMGGDSADLFASPTDPIFFLHHSMVDRIYWLWQALHPKEAKKIAGTITILNKPPSRDALLTDVLDLGVNAKPITIGDALSTLGNSPFCYIYL
ncbi:unnamed protein product [Clonostachys rhizophaga]|uniref:Tyrosinase copper-binding domain-containing protein n=1 Tax=Clonostachys rhizophaga TaxID=160324 RepID=A0A9N9VJ00_9HYPO|nr:unnamed protein product [Clonostachys rhizophaga]